MVNQKKYKGGSVRANLTLPQELVDKVDELAKKDGLSRSEYIANILGQSLGMNVYDFAPDRDTMVSFISARTIERPKRKPSRPKVHDKPGRPKKTN